MYNSGNSSKNVRGSNIIDGTVETVDIADDAVTADKLATTVNADIATGVSGSTIAGDALPKAGGAMTGAITTNSTFDGRDVAADGVTADAALPKTGGTMTGDITGAAIATLEGVTASLSPAAAETIFGAGSHGRWLVMVRQSDGGNVWRCSFHVISSSVAASITSVSSQYITPQVSGTDIQLKNSNVTYAQAFSWKALKLN